MEVWLGWLILWAMLGGLIFFHESGHALVARAIGLKPKRMILGFPWVVSFKVRGFLVGLGPIMLLGFTELDLEELEKTIWWKKSLILIAGPIANGIIFLLIYLPMRALGLLDWPGLSKVVHQVFPDVGECGDVGWFATARAIPHAFQSPIAVAGTIAVLSLILGLLNILPIPPLDGSKVVLMIIQALLGKRMKTTLEVIFILIALIFVGFNLFSLGGDVIHQVRYVPITGGC